MAQRPFEELVSEHGPLVLCVCRALLGRADAEDAWSETFLSALRAYPALPHESDVRAWLVTIAHRKALDQLRGAARRARPLLDPSEVPAPARTAAQGGWHGEEELRAALESLPFKQRGAVVYRYLAGLSYAEIGALLGSSPTAARRSAADGIAKLRQHERLRRGRHDRRTR